MAKVRKAKKGSSKKGSSKKITKIKRKSKKIRANKARATYKAKEKKKVKMRISKISKRTVKIKKQREANKKKLKRKQIKVDLEHLNNLLSQAYARQLLIDTGGENALAIVRNFTESLNDEELAKRLKLRISDVRATLNRLHNEGLVNYSREKDNESGWYSYTWSLNEKRIKEWIEEKSKKQKLDVESEGDHYFCPSCGLETLMPFEKAVESGFRCLRCERPLEFIDNEKMNELVNSNKERVILKK